MADATIDLLKAQFRQLRLPTMGREFEKLARDAAASNQNYFQFLLRLTEIELADPLRHRSRDPDQERGIPGLEGLRDLRLQLDTTALEAKDPGVGTL